MRTYEDENVITGILVIAGLGALIGVMLGVSR